MVPLLRDRIAQVRHLVLPRHAIRQLGLEDARDGHLRGHFRSHLAHRRRHRHCSFGDRRLGGVAAELGRDHFAGLGHGHSTLRRLLRGH